jgi:hypothetical protein
MTVYGVDEAEIEIWAVLITIVNPCWRFYAIFYATYTPLERIVSSQVGKSDKMTKLPSLSIVPAYLEMVYNVTVWPSSI